MSDVEEEFQKLVEIYDFSKYDFGPASDDPIAMRMALPERYAKDRSSRGDGNQNSGSAPNEP